MLISMLNAHAQELSAYKIYNAKGEEVVFGEMVHDLQKSKVILLGEQHNNPICHWLQMEVTKAVYEKDSSLVIGAEMFEADNQLVIDEYLAGWIKSSHLEKESKIWPNYDTDYKPLMDFAKSQNLSFIATNVPRRYASLVSYRGVEVLEELSGEAKSNMVPLPFDFDPEAPGYKELLEMDFGHGHTTRGGHSHDEELGPINMVKAQALKDATMAHFITQNLGDAKHFIHYQGDFHSSNYGGIYWYLKHTDKKLKVATVSMVEASDLNWDGGYTGRADFVVVIPSGMTKTH